MNLPERALVLVLCLLAPPVPWAALAPVTPDLEGAASSADAEAARFCHPLHFVAYSTLEPSGRRVEESVSWDDAHKAYVVRGPVLGLMLDHPGVRSIPTGDQAENGTFRIAVRSAPSAPVDRFCQTDFQEFAECDPHGDITYTQTYTDCGLQTLQHVVRLTPDSAGALPLLAVRFADVRGQFGNPLYLAAGSDLRLRVR